MIARRSLLSVMLLVCLGGWSALLPAFAFERSFPPHAKRGMMKPDLFPTINIDGKPRILTPGARIWNAVNLTQTPGSLPPQPVVVNYTENDAAYIDRIWILTSAEAAQSPKEQKIEQPRLQNGAQ